MEAPILHILGRFYKGIWLFMPARNSALYISHYTTLEGFRIHLLNRPTLRPDLIDFATLQTVFGLLYSTMNLMLVVIVIVILTLIVAVLLNVLMI